MSDRNDKQVIFKNSDLLADCIYEIKNTSVDNAKNLDVVMLMHNLIKYSESWEQYCRDGPDNSLTDYKSFKFISRFLNKCGGGSTVDVQITIP